MAGSPSLVTTDGFLEVVKVTYNQNNTVGTKHCHKLLAITITHEKPFILIRKRRKREQISFSFHGKLSLPSLLTLTVNKTCVL